MNRRIFVEKKGIFDVESPKILNDIKKPRSGEINSIGQSPMKIKDRKSRGAKHQNLNK